MNRLDKIEARANAATEGPWNVFMGRIDHPGRSLVAVAYDVGCDEDAEFIAHARADVPDMAAALRAVLDLHIPDYTYPDCPKCAECSDLASTEARRVAVTWPCPTVAEIHHCLGDDL